ncbi:MAG: hypothetical protein LBL07_08205 [Tannerella sp.]|jgi:hypothetical protein|nr:hypothetical protein [Tannerella sp.]
MNPITRFLLLSAGTLLSAASPYAQQPVQLEIRVFGTEKEGETVKFAKEMTGISNREQAV